MATGTYSTADSGVLTATEYHVGSYGSFFRNMIGTRMSGVNNDVRKKIPKYSKINSAKVTIQVKKTNSSLFSTDGSWVLRNMVDNDSSNLEITKTLKTYDSGIKKDTYNTFEYNCLSYISSETNLAGQATSIYVLSFYVEHNGVTADFYHKDYKYTCNFTYPTITYNLSASEGGEVGFLNSSNSYDYKSAASKTFDVQISAYTHSINARPKTGYKFVKWSDGNTSATRTVSISESTIETLSGGFQTIAPTLTAIFEPISYVTYDSIFSFQKWKETGISGIKTNITDVSNIGFTMTITDSNDPMTNTTPTMSVVAGQRYVLEFDTDITDAFQPFIFYCINENNNSWTQEGGGGTHTDGTPTYNQKRIEFTPTTNWISLRFDIDGSVGRSGHFSNFRIYPAGHDYMSTTVAAEDRTDFGSWSMTTPIRTGYRFLGWYTQPNGGGTKYTSSSAFPATETILYSHWEIAKSTITFKNQDGTTIKSSTVQSGTPLGTLPAVSREGYTFAGWIPCAPAVKTDGSILDSCLYDGNTAYPLDTKYKYTNNLSIHIEAYMEDWVDIKSRQLMSCTEGGGWGLGYQANTDVDGAESHGFEVHTGSGYTGYDLKFGSTDAYSNNKWYSFDVVFSNGVIEIFVDGVSKGRRTASDSSISYSSYDNTIFVGAEAGKNDTDPGGNYFKGLISNVFIANQGTRLMIETGTSSNTAITESVDYYPIWRLKSEQKKNQIYIGDKLIKEIYIGTNKVKEVYIGTTKIYG